ncbi:hypothetical protein Tco_0583671 [Tanacetum coccineum]
MYLTASRPDITFAVCACARFQVTPKISHLHAVKRIIRYLKGQPNLGLGYPRDSPFDLETFSNNDYAGASLDRKSTTGGCQFLGKRLFSWQCKKQTIVYNSTTEAEYVSAANCCGQVLWIQNQMLDYGFNFMNTKIYIDNESTICIMKNPVFHSKTKHIEIRHHFIRDSNEKKLIQDRQSSMAGFDEMRPLEILRLIDAQTRFETASKQSNDPPLSRDYTLGSGEDSMKLLELMELCTKLSDLIQALVDKKKVIITETSIRSDLHLEDANGTDCLPTATIFEELARMGTYLKLCRAYELCDKNEQLHVFDSEDTLKDAEKSQLKMNEFQKDEKVQELKIKPIDYTKLNKLYDDFVPQKELSAEQTYFPSSVISSEKVSSETKPSMASMPSANPML